MPPTVSPTMPDPLQPTLVPEDDVRMVPVYEVISRLTSMAAGQVSDAVNAAALDMSPTHRHVLSQKLRAWVDAGAEMLQSWDVIAEPERTPV